MAKHAKNFFFFAILDFIHKFAASERDGCMAYGKRDDRGRGGGGVRGKGTNEKTDKEGLIKNITSKTV